MSLTPFWIAYEVRLPMFPCVEVKDFGAASAHVVIHRHRKGARRCRRLLRRFGARGVMDPGSSRWVARERRILAAFEAEMAKEVEAIWSTGTNPGSVLVGLSQ